MPQRIYNPSLFMFPFLSVRLSGILQYTNTRHARQFRIVLSFLLVLLYDLAAMAGVQWVGILWVVFVHGLCHLGRGRAMK